MHFHPQAFLPLLIAVSDFVCVPGQAMFDVLSFMDGRNLWAHPHFAAAAPLRRAMCTLWHTCH